MLTPQERAAVGNVTRIMQIIIVALAAGVGAYLGFAAINRAEREDQHPLAIGGLAFAAAATAAAFVVPTIMAGQLRKSVAEGAPTPAGNSGGDGDAAKLLGGYQTQKIIRAALFEGAAFMNIFVYQSGGPTYSLGISIALLLAIVMQFPLRALVEQWLDRELREVRELRQLRR